MGDAKTRLLTLRLNGKTTNSILIQQKWCKSCFYPTEIIGAPHLSSKALKKIEIQI